MPHAAQKPARITNDPALRPQAGEALDDYLQRRAQLFCDTVRGCGLGVGEDEALRLNRGMWTQEYAENASAPPR